MDAISQVGGISQLSSTKMWVARPSPSDRGKSTILAVDWEAVAKRGINTTNYMLQPGDRFVIGQDTGIYTNQSGRQEDRFRRAVHGLYRLDLQYLERLGQHISCRQGSDEGTSAEGSADG